MSSVPLRIDNEEFMTLSLIDKAPRSMMVREFTMNGIESAQNAKGEKIVHWTSNNWKFVNERGETVNCKKAVIWNTGTGMNQHDLKKAVNLAVEMEEKKLGLDKNFGVGAKVSSLKSNKIGVRYRSCKDKIVHEVTIGYDEKEKVYALFNHSDDEGHWEAALNVTEEAKNEDIWERGLDQDWTEVMLLGNSPEQDTSEQFFDDEETGIAYVATTLWRRFYRLPEDVKVRLDSNYHRMGVGPERMRPFRPMSQIKEGRFERIDEVPLPDLGLSIHFQYKLKQEGVINSVATLCGLIHKNEIYSVATGREWSSIAQNFGIPFGAKKLSVLIELNDDQVTPATYRNHLNHRGTNAPVTPEHYAEIVCGNLPEWVKEVIKQESPTQDQDLSDIDKSLQKHLERLKVKIAGAKKTNSEGGASENSETGAPSAGVGDRASAGANPQPNPSLEPLIRKFRPVREGVKLAGSHKMYEKAPKIKFLKKEHHVDAQQIVGKAAKLNLRGGELYINTFYEAIGRAVEEILPVLKAETKGDEETIRRELTIAVQRAIALQVGKAAVYAMAKRSVWKNEKDVEKAQSPEALSIAADDYDGSISSIKKEARKRIKLAQVSE